MISKEELGKLIKSAREAKAKEINKRYTQKTLASDIGKSQSYIGDIESGRTYPTLVVLSDIALACGVSLSFFSDIENKIEEYVGKQLGDYPAETQDMVKDYIRRGNEKLNFLSGQAQHDITLEGFPKVTEVPSASITCSDNFSKQDIRDTFPISTMTQIPILGTVAAGVPLYAEQHILGYEEVPQSLVKSGEYFFLIVQGDSMTGSRIFSGDKVLIRKQTLVENGEIALVLVNGDEATLKRVKYLNGTAILYPDNPSYEPMVYPISDVEVIGYVAQVIFNPNAKK